WGMNTPAYFCIDQLNHHDVAPEVVKPVPTIGENGFFQEVFYVDLDSVFHDADSDLLLKLEYIDNTDLVFGNLIKAGKPKGTEKTMLALNIVPNKTGMAEITISATSNGKTVYHTFNLIVRVPVDVGYLLQNELKIYPNPVKDVFFVEVPPNANQIVLTDLSGKVLYRQKTNSASNLKISSLTGLSDGIYILSLDFENKKIKRKIVKR
ncbi:MAG TPA: T9SS type A sorting domain-containing protein, partial [Prolixibacteraceae bacterium]|nr:T9SS type A sorting domain-containing protein [Prolixibacteraceae bacterium]